MFKKMIIGLGIASLSFAGNIKNVEAITETFGDGEKLSAVVLTYDKEILGNSVSASDYKVEGRDIEKVYVSKQNEKNGKKSKTGKYVILELKRLPMVAQASDHSKEDMEKKKATGQKGPTLGGKGNPKPLETITAEVTQIGNIQNIDGKVYLPEEKQVSTKTRQLIIENFKQFEFTGKDGKTLKYNLYMPKNYDPSKKYPLVVFMHDAGAVSSETKYTLSQGNGATVWATPEWQEKHPSFVLAPQYEVVTVNDNYEYGPELDRTVELINDLTEKYSIDKDRIYNTGQSMGGMSSISLDSRYPDLFGGSYIVASKWDVNVTGPMKDQNIWFVASEGDPGAYPSLTEISDYLEKNGAKVQRMTIDAEKNQNEINKEVQSKISSQYNIYYTVYKNGNHRYTWQHAYYMKPAMEWLFRQKRNSVKIK